MQAANTILGSQNLVAVLGIVTAVGSMISMAICPLLIKRWVRKGIYPSLGIWLCCIGTIVRCRALLVQNPDNTVLTVLFYASLFLIGLQFAAVTLMPMIMTADCVDYYEFETGKRMEGAAYSILTLTIKVCLALGTALGLVFIQVSGYSDTVAQIAAGTASGFSEKTKDIVFLLIPWCPAFLLSFPYSRF